MANLPSKENLEWLDYERGHDALVWYAWRNALRALPFLGRAPLQAIWRENTVSFSYVTIRVSLLLAQWNNRADKQDHIVLKAAATSAASATYAAVAAADAKADFKYLKQTKDWTWLGKDLWSKTLFASTKPKKFTHYEQTLLKSLTELGLDFPADDLQDVWAGRPLKPHALNYWTELSETITNDPVLLRRAILYGESTDQIQAVRVLLLGSGGAGKTSLAKRLKGESQTGNSQAATLGVDYQQHEALKLHEKLPELNLKPDPLDLYLWDFGGQTIFHGLHRAFLHENCVYVLVVDNRHEQAPEQWLYQIRHLAGAQAKVLLVTNEYENCHARQNKNRLLREFPDLLDQDSFFYFSCLNPEITAFKTFVEALVQACLESRRSVFSSTMRLQRALTEQYQTKVFLHEQYVEGLAEGWNIDIPSAINQLIQLGFLVRVKSGSLQYCLKPAWAIDNAYKLLYAECIVQKAGSACIRTLNQVFAKELEPEHIEYLAEFLNERELCCVLANKNYFFPDAAPADEPDSVQTLLDAKPNVFLRFDLPYLPLGFHARLVHQLFNENLAVTIQNVQDIWRTGFILSAPKSKALVQYQLRKASIELVLTGAVVEFAKLFQAFFPALKHAVINKNGITESHLNLSLLFNDQPFSIDSGQDLLVALKEVRTVKDLSEELSKMTGKNINVTVGNHSQVAIDAQNVTQKQSSDNTTVEISQDQRQQLAVLMDELLKTNPKGKDLVTIGTVQAALETPNDAKSKNLLAKVWTGVKELGVFTKDTVVPILEKKDVIISTVGAAVAAAASWL